MKHRNFFTWVIGKIRSGIKYKLAVIYVLVVSLPLIFFGMLSSNTAARTIEDDYSNYKKNLNKQIINSMDENINNLTRQSTSTFFMLDDMNLILGTPLSRAGSDYFSAKNRVTQYILSIASSNDLVNGIALINMQGDVVISWDKGNMPTLSGTTQGSQWFQRTIALKGAPLIREPHQNEFYDTASHSQAKSKNQAVISICRSIRNFDLDEGLLIFDQSLPSFIGSLKLNPDPGELILIFGQTGQLIYSSGDADDSLLSTIWKTAQQDQGSLKDLVSGKEMIVNYNTSEISGWKVVSLLPVAQLQAKSGFLKSIAISMFAVTVILILLISILASNIITIPLHRLMKSFDTLKKGDFNTSVTVRGNDELALIGTTFNSMVLEIKNLINQKYELEMLKKQAELESLQSQINPHFLFNTIFSINEVVISGNREMASLMLMNLADIFRYSLSKRQHEICFAEELEYLKKYLYLQKCRFGEKYRISYMIDDNIMRFGILRLTLQPIVENSLLHGLDPKCEPGELTITATSFGEYYAIYVWDNGVGIEADHLAQINGQLDNPEISDNGASPTRIGIFNVNSRIKYHYGNPYGIHIESTPGVETLVKITLPAKML